MLHYRGVLSVLHHRGVFGCFTIGVCYRCFTIGVCYRCFTIGVCYWFFTIGVCSFEFIGNNIRINNYCKTVCIVQATNCNTTKCITITQYMTINLLKKLSAFKLLCLTYY